MPGSPFPLPGAPQIPALAMDPKGEYLYASAAAGAGAVAAFIIDQTSGALTPVHGSPFILPVGSCNPNADFCQEGPTDLAIAPTGNYLYGALGVESAMAGFVIDRSTGALSNLPGSPYPEQNSFGNFCPFDAFGSCPYSWTMSMDPSGKFVYLADMDFNQFSIFSLNTSTGVPTYAGATPGAQAGICIPYTVDVDPSGTFVYSLGGTTNGCTSGTNAVLGFSIDQGKGSLKSVSGSPFANSNVHTTTVSEEKVLVTR